MANRNVHSGGDRTYWEELASTRWGAYIADIEQRAILKAHRLSGKPGTALDVGAGGGRWSVLLADQGWSTICTDIDGKTLATCKKRLPTATCIRVKPDDKGFPCESEAVHLLLCIEVPPVIQADWFVSEAFRVLHNGGLVVGVFWNLVSFRGFLAHTTSSFRGSFDYYRFSYPSWRRCLLRRGFSILSEEGYCWFPFRRASNSVFAPGFVRLEERLGLRKLALVSPWIVFIARKLANEHVVSS